MRAWRNLKTRWRRRLRAPACHPALAANRTLEDRHKGQRCFILATGPSIKQQDLRRLRGELLISVSNFFVHPHNAEITPQYHCVPAFHPPIEEESWQRWLAEMAAANPKATLLFSITDLERNQRQGQFAGRALHFLDFTGSWETIAAEGVDLTRAVPAPQSVTVMALYLALYLGCDPIHLLGCDHDWILHVNQSTHFYSEGQHALVRGNYNEWFGGDFGTYCEDYVRLWQQYRALRAAAAKRSTRILNATAGGLLDVFQRVNYESVTGGA